MSLVPTGVVLSVMGLVSLGLADLPSAFARVSGYSDGEGQGDLGAGKLYVSVLFQGAFVTLAAILLAGALTCFGLAAIERRRRG